MTNRHRLKIFPVCAALLVSFRALAQLHVPSYQVGETARVEVVATVALVVIDPAKTDALKRKEMARLPIIYRLDTNAATEAVMQLHEAFALKRQNFLVTLQAALDGRGQATQRLARAILSFQASHKNFPLTARLAQAWAKGEPDAEFITPLEEKLIVAMSAPIYPAAQPTEAMTGGLIRLVPGDRTSVLLPGRVERTEPVAHSILVSLDTRRDEMVKQFPEMEKTAARFLASFVQPTCFPEVALTLELRERQVADLSSVNRYQPGGVIVRAGDVVNAGAKAALDEFRARLALLQGVPPPVPTLATHAPTHQLWPWLLTGGVLFLLVEAGVFWFRSRRRALALALVPEPPGPEALAALRNDPILRARLTEHLTRLLGQTLVQRLFAQRGQLLDAQQAATGQAASLEQRLEKVQSDMQERFLAYEQRIAGLEQELTAAEEQNRDLIRAKIALAKEELGAEQARGRPDWN